MEALTFFSAMNRGQFREEQGIEGSSYCIFFAPMEELVTQDRMTGREDRVVLELLYGDEMLPGALRVRQVGSNAVVEESTQGAFRAFLEEKPVKYIGQLLMYALQFKIQDLSLRIEGCTGEMKQLEDALDNCIDNSGTYRLLALHRVWEYGAGGKGDPVADRQGLLSDADAEQLCASGRGAAGVPLPGGAV